MEINEASSGLLSDDWIPPGSLFEAIKRHYNEKVKNRVCECCGATAWIPTVGDADADNYLVLQNMLKVPVGKGYGPWPIMGFGCVNCHHLRLFAVQPVITNWIAAGGRFPSQSTEESEE